VGRTLYYRKTDAPKSLEGISPVKRCSYRRRDGEDRVGAEDIKGASERFNTKDECLWSLSGRLARRSGYAAMQALGAPRGVCAWE
jgi:hypothetical protein